MRLIGCQPVLLRYDLSAIGELIAEVTDERKTAREVA
jgi:hypothetical protein